MISIIIPVFNSSKYIEATLFSIYRSLKNIENPEVIIIDDGSTDNSSLVISNFINNCSKKIKNIYIYKSNGGVSSARNLGINIASNNWVFFLDSDDFISKNYYFEDLYNSKIDLVMFKFEYKLSNQEKLIESHVGKAYIDMGVYKAINIINGIIMKDDYNIELLTESIIYSREFLNKHEIRFNEEIRVGEDILFIFNALSKANDVEFNSRIISTYNIRDNSTTNKFNIARYDGVSALCYIAESNKIIKKNDSYSKEKLTSYLYLRAMNQLVSIYIDNWSYLKLSFNNISKAINYTNSFSHASKSKNVIELGTYISSKINYKLNSISIKYRLIHFAFIRLNYFLIIVIKLYYLIKKIYKRIL